MIPSEKNGSFVANMEMVLDVYKRSIFLTSQGHNLISKGKGNEI